MEHNFVQDIYTQDQNEKPSMIKCLSYGRTLLIRHEISSVVACQAKQIIPPPGQTSVKQTCVDVWGEKKRG